MPRMNEQQNLQKKKENKVITIDENQTTVVSYHKKSLHAYAK